MYSAIHVLGRRFLTAEVPTGAFAFVIAELFYKFHSFALECLAFLATWYVLSLGYASIEKMFFRRSERPPGGC
jgi:hypothetical protein